MAASAAKGGGWGILEIATNRCQPKTPDTLPERVSGERMGKIMDSITSWLWEQYGCTNVRVKHYLRSAQINVASYNIYGKDPYYKARHKAPAAADPERSEAESKYRAKRAVRDIAMCNDFRWFFTLTFSKELVDRYSPEETYKKVSNWLRESVRRRGMKYVAVPELHSDGAIHVHGLAAIRDDDLVRAYHPKWKKPLKDKHGNPVYNLSTWRFGFSDVTPLQAENIQEKTSYICEYITEGKTKIWGKWYLSSRNCQKKPVIVDLPPTSQDEMIDDDKLDDGRQRIFQLSSYLTILIEQVPYEDKT